MISFASELRLQQLESNINKVLQLLNEYESELLDEDDPGRRSKYRRRIEDLSQQRSKYEEEFSQLRVQLEQEDPLQAQAFSNKLQKIDIKIDLLLSNQAHLFQALMQHFSPREQRIVYPLTQQLDESNLIKLKAFLEAIDKNQISEQNAHLMLKEIQDLVRIFHEKELCLPAENEIIAEIINSPEIDAKHALKVSIPIIPFILSYEGELGLGTGINLKKAWENLKTNFGR